jgi:hypothetical protein
MSQAQAELAHQQDLPSRLDDEAVDGPVGFVLIGDSQANSYIAGLSDLAKQLNMSFDIFTMARCPIMYDVTSKGSRREECREVRDQALARLQATTLPVIIAQAWDIYTDAITNFEFDGASALPSADQSVEKLQAAVERTIGNLIRNNRHILIIGDQVRTGCAIDRGRLLQGPLPHKPQPPCLALGRDAAEASTSRFNAMLARLQAKWPANVELLRPVDYICDAECPVKADGLWLYYDRTHFSVAGSKYMAHRASDVFYKFLGFGPDGNAEHPGRAQRQ